MRADGLIRIMDWDKFVVDSGNPVSVCNQVRDILLGPVTYLQKLGDKEYITDYVGDNIYNTSVLRNLAYYGLDKGCWDDVRDYDRLVLDIKTLPFTDSEFVRLCRFLWNDCGLATWEVWS